MLLKPYVSASDLFCNLFLVGACVEMKSCYGNGIWPDASSKWLTSFVSFSSIHHVEFVEQVSAVLSFWLIDEILVLSPHRSNLGRSCFRLSEYTSSEVIHSLIPFGTWLKNSVIIAFRFKISSRSRVINCNEIETILRELFFFCLFFVFQSYFSIRRNANRIISYFCKSEILTRIMKRFY